MRVFIFIIKHLLDLGGLKKCSSDNFIVMIVLQFDSMLSLTLIFVIYVCFRVIYDNV